MSRYRAFLRDYRAAFEHRGGVKALLLASLNEAWFEKLRAECLEISGAEASSDVTSPDHSTHWTRPQGSVNQFSLFNETGRSDDYRSDFGGRTDVKARKLVFPGKPAIARLAALFGSELRNMRLNLIGRKSSLQPHEEGSILSTPRGVDYVARFHVPIITNPGARVLLDNELFHFASGGLYFFHHGCVHGAVNEADEERYHIVIDAFLTRKLFDNLFDPDTPAPQGLTKRRGAERRPDSEPFETRDFATESGVIMKDLLYGRQAPGFLAYYQKNYPSLFSLFH